MSELIRTSSLQGDFRRQLFATASTIVVAAALAGSTAYAEEADRPTIWIELGGQLERVDGSLDPVAPPFTTISPRPAVYNPVSPIEAQQPSRYAFGGEGKITITPEHSEWIFSAGVRYGRSNGKRKIQQQSEITKQVPSFGHAKYPSRYPTYITKTAIRNSLSNTENSSSHVVLDFQVGRDVGLGAFGGRSNVNLGVRYAEFASKSSIDAIARPSPVIYTFTFFGLPFPATKHNEYLLNATNDRSFRGIGPSLSWDASAPVVGNTESGEITVDWSVNGAVLFGRQKAKGTHETTANFVTGQPISAFRTGGYQLYHHAVPHDRSTSVVVPNIGGTLGVSFRFPNAKVSFGYRADFFFGAMDSGIDLRKTSDIGFHGPFATISVGLGG